MELAELIAKAEQDHKAEMAELVRNKLSLERQYADYADEWESAMKAYREAEAKWEETAEETWGCDEEVDAWDRELYGDYYDEFVEEHRYYADGIEWEMNQVQKKIYDCENLMEQSEITLTAKIAALTKEHQETAVLRWLN